MGVLFYAWDPDTNDVYHIGKIILHIENVRDLDGEPLAIYAHQQYRRRGYGWETLGPQDREWWMEKTREMKEFVGRSSDVVIVSENDTVWSVKELLGPFHVVGTMSGYEISDIQKWMDIWNETDGLSDLPSGMDRDEVKEMVLEIAHQREELRKRCREGPL